VLSPGTGFLAPVSRQRLRAALGASTGAPGPHDLTVRRESFVRAIEITPRHRTAHRIPASRLVTTARTPLFDESGMARVKHSF
jgi:hypothetical protein